MTSGIERRRRTAQSDKKNLSYQRRRQEIIEAAAHVFRARGFNGASLGDVAAYLGTDRANLYYYVGSKEELFDIAVSEAVEANVQRAREVYAADLSAPDKLHRLMRELMASYAEHYPFLYVFIQQDLRQIADKRVEWAKRMRKCNRDFEDVVIRVIQDGYDRGEFVDRGPARLAAYGVLGMLAWTNRWFDPGRSEYSADTVGRMFADMVVRGLTSDAGSD